jgi:hypothetical protein
MEEGRGGLAPHVLRYKIETNVGMKIPPKLLLLFDKINGPEINGT